MAIVLASTSGAAYAQADQIFKVPGAPSANVASAYGTIRNFHPVSFSAADTTNADAQAQLQDLRPLSLPQRFLHNEEVIWSSPARSRTRDLEWIIPSAGLTAAFIATDADSAPELRRGISTDTAKKFSDAGLASYFVLGGGLFVAGKMFDNDHFSSTGIEVGEALAHGFLVSTGTKYIFQRGRPLDGNRRGEFFSGDDSFPSGHSMMAWSAASVIAHEYPGPLTKLLVYGMAGAVSASRVAAGKHFPSDVFVGGLAGWLMGRQVYRSAHEEEALYGTFSPGDESPVQPASPYVPLESWMYDVVDRLAGMGLVDSAFSAQRPWTRSEFLRLAQEAQDNSELVGASPLAQEMIRSLMDELQSEARDGRASSFHLDSVYTRVMGIAGQPLDDGYHFGETIPNDYGRFHREGMSAITGASGYANFGRLMIYVRGEYEHAPSMTPLSPTAISAIEAADFGTPYLPKMPDTVNRVRLLDAYASYPLGDWQVSFGKQSLWWGPGESGALNFSNNAEPVLMLRLSRTHPTKLPGFLGLLGPYRSEFFMGRLDGHHFIHTNFAGDFGPVLQHQPLIHGEKLSFKPTPNLEFGVSATTLFGGDGYPLNARIFLRSFGISNTNPGAINDPGDRRSGFDFRYRIPGLRRYVTLYNDSLSEDEFNPIAYPRRSAMAPGILISQLPGAEQVQLRFEAAYTALPNLRGRGVHYTNGRFQNGFTNQGDILGDPVGPEGVRYLAQLSYWFSSTNKLDFKFHHTNVDNKFIEWGGN
jgi:hypothetical protein